MQAIKAEVKLEGDDKADVLRGVQSPQQRPPQMFAQQRIKIPVQV